MASESQIVEPYAWYGHAASLHPHGPKLTITCGACYERFKARAGDAPDPILKCPACHAPNRIAIRLDHG